MTAACRPAIVARTVKVTVEVDVLSAASVAVMTTVWAPAARVISAIDVPLVTRAPSSVACTVATPDAASVAPNVRVIFCEMS